MEIFLCFLAHDEVRLLFNDLLTLLFCFCFTSSMSFRGFIMYTQRVFLHFEKSIIFQLSIIVSLNIKLVNELRCFGKISVFAYITLNLWKTYNIAHKILRDHPSNQVVILYKMHVISRFFNNNYSRLDCIILRFSFTIVYITLTRKFETFDNLLILQLLQCLWKWLFDFGERAVSGVLPLISNRKTNNVFACQVISFQLLIKK